MLKVRDLYVVAYAGGFTHWYYKAGTDTLKTVEADGFFNDVNDMLATGNMITVCASDGRGINLWVLADRSGGVVRTSREAGSDER